MSPNLNHTAIQARLGRVRTALPEAGVDALLVSQAENRRYLSGFTGSSGWLLITANVALLATDFRYFEQMGLESPDFELVKYGLSGGSFAGEGLPAMLALAGVERVGFEADAATWGDVQMWMEAAPTCTWVPTRGFVLGLRAVKDAGEIETLRRAIALADEGIAAGLSQVHPGMRERDLAWAIETYLRTHGAEGVSFETIVAAGPNGARPHARAGNTALPAGEPIVIDMGALLDGYCSDLTRTVCLGQPKDADRFWKVYNTVLQAQKAVEAAVRPGMTGRQVDSVARNLIAEAGYGGYFGHGLGHGVGLAIHEEPRFSQSNPGVIKAGHVVTVEPGIYLPGWGGVRIEDVVLITDNGAEVLTTAPKDPIIPVF